MCCAFIASSCATALGMLQDNEDSMGRVKKTGNAVWDAYIMLQANSGQFFKAFFAYQGIVDSKTYTCQKVLSFAGLFWGIVAMWITIENIVRDSLACDAKIILWFMHTYAWFFLLFLTWTVLGLLLWVVKKLSGLTVVTGPIMAGAKEADSEIPFQLPVFQTLARSFLLRDSSTMLHIKAKEVEAAVVTMEKEIEDMKNKMALRKGYLDQLEYRRNAAAAHEASLVEAYKDKVHAEGGELPGEIILIGDTDLFAGAPTAEDLLQQAETGALAAHEQGLDATLAQSQAAASAAAAAAMENEQVASMMNAGAAQAAAAQASAAAAQEAAMAAANSPEAQAYLAQAQAAAEQAQAAQAAAMASAMENEQFAGMAKQAGDAASAAQAKAKAAAESPEAQAYMQQAEAAASSATQQAEAAASSAGAADAPGIAPASPAATSQGAAAPSPPAPGATPPAATQQAASQPPAATPPNPDIAPDDQDSY